MDYEHLRVEREGALARVTLERPRSLNALNMRLVDELGHYFGGLTYPEIAGALGISESTVHEDLRGARVWLLQQLGGAAAAT